MFSGTFTYIFVDLNGPLVSMIHIKANILWLSVRFFYPYERIHISNSIGKISSFLIVITSSPSSQSSEKYIHQTMARGLDRI